MAKRITATPAIVVVMVDDFDHLFFRSPGKVADAITASTGVLVASVTVIEKSSGNTSQTGRLA